MSASRQWLLILLLAGLGAIAGYLFALPKPNDCRATIKTAEISERAANVCVNQLVGCSLSHEQLKGIIREAEAAKACK